LIELYSQIKDWFKESLPGQHLPGKNDVKEYFTKIWGDLTGCGWKGYKIRTIEEEIESGDAVILEEDDLVNYNKQSKPPL
jgi:hypothetical protein